MRRIAVIAAVSLLLVAGCTGTATRESGVPRTASTPGSASEFPFEEVAQGPITSVEYKPDTSMAIVATETAQPAATVIILHGHNTGTSAYLQLAESLAEKGVAVFLPEWTDTLPSDEDPRAHTITDGLDDVADAVRFVRLYATRYGGDPGRIVIVGHSLGAAAALTTMLAGDRFGTAAFPDDVNALPDGYISLDGVVPFREQLWNEDLRRRYNEDPVTWDKINPDTYLDRAAVRRGVPYRFFVATLDFEETRSMASRMSRLGYDSSVERIEVGHMQAAQPQTATVDAIVQMARSR